MKLAEALQERADLSRNIEQPRNRLSSSALVQEDEQPVECPENLKQELDASISRLSYLITRINRTSCQTVAEGQTLIELITQKGALSLKLHVYRDIVYTRSQMSYRARNTEIKIRSVFSVADWQKEIDRVSKELRRLDSRLQESNWKTDLVEQAKVSGSGSKANVTRRQRGSHRGYTEGHVRSSSPQELLCSDYVQMYCDG